MPENTEMLQDGAVEAGVKLFRHLPPTSIADNLSLVAETCPVLGRRLRMLVDAPSRVVVASGASSREFLACESCVVDGHYRCPWDGRFYSLSGELQEAVESETQSEELKRLEGALNEAVSAYAVLYYGSEALTSAFVQLHEKQLFVTVLIKKTTEMDGADADASSKGHGSWDSIHVFEIGESDEETEHVYRLTTSVLLSFANSTETLQNITLAGSLMRQNEARVRKQDGGLLEHIVQIGRMLENAEGSLRSDLQTVYFGRTHDIAIELRVAVPDGYLRHQNDLREEMMARLAQRQ